MKDVIKRSKELIETTINRMKESCDPEIKAGIKGDKITGAMLPYVTTIEDTTSTITPQQICDYIDLLYENDREYNLYMLKKEIEDSYMFREAYVFEAATYILKNQELDDNKEYTVSEIKNIFNQAFEGKEVTKEAELDI